MKYLSHTFLCQNHITMHCLLYEGKLFLLSPGHLLANDCSTVIEKLKIRSQFNFICILMAIGCRLFCKILLILRARSWPNKITFWATIFQKDLFDHNFWALRMTILVLRSMFLRSMNLMVPFIFFTYDLDLSRSWQLRNHILGYISVIKGQNVAKF